MSRARRAPWLVAASLLVAGTTATVAATTGAVAATTGAVAATDLESGAWGEVRGPDCTSPGRPAYVLRAGIIFVCWLARDTCEVAGFYDIADGLFHETPPVGRTMVLLEVPAHAVGRGVSWHFPTRDVVSFATHYRPPSAYRRCSQSEWKRAIEILGTNDPAVLDDADRRLLGGD